MSIDRFKKPSFSGIALIALLAVSYSAQAADRWPRTFSIGYQKFGTLIILKSRGDLERRLAPYGVHVKWAEFFAGSPICEAMNGGSVDFGITGETPPIFAQAAAGSVVRYVAFEPPSPAGEAIVVPNDSSIRSVADLKGKTVAVARGSNSQYLLVRALENAGLRFSDIKVSYLTPADANAAFVQHSIDAWSIWDYYFAAAQARSGARVLVNGSDGLAYNHAFFLASQPFLSKYPNVISIALEEVAKVDAWTKANPAAAARLLSKSLGLPPDILEIALKRAGFGPATLTPDVIAAQQRIADTVYNIGLIPDHFNVADTVWNKPLVQTASH